MNDKSNCYVEVVKRNYYCEMKQVVIPKIHLIFLSKSDYKKINEIEKPFEKYYELEVKNEKESILYNYLKEIIRYLKEREVIKVFGDHIKAFRLKYRYIHNFKVRVSINPEEEYVSERMNEKLFKVLNLLFDKIRNL